MTPELLATTPPGMIVLRMLNNLRSIYADREDFARTARVLGRQLQLTPGDISLRRDLGVTLVRSGKSGAAIDHLKAYLESAPYAEDVNEAAPGPEPGPGRHRPMELTATCNREGLEPFSPGGPLT